MSAFHVCQTSNCKADAEYKCSCNLLLCNNHTKRHHAQQGLDHQPTVILLPLEEDDLVSLSRLDMSSVVNRKIKQEIDIRNGRIQNLHNQIKDIEKETSSKIREIMKSIKAFELVLAEIKEKEMLPLVSSSSLANRLANLLKHNQLIIANVEEVISNELSIHDSTSIGQNAENSLRNNRQEIADRDFQNLKECLKIQAHSDPIKLIEISPCKRFIASLSRDKIIKIWNSNTGGLENSLKSHTDIVKSINFNHLGNLLVSGSRDNTAIIWNLNRSGLSVIYSEHKAGVEAVCFSPDSQIVASGSRQLNIHLWSANTGAKLTELVGHCNAVTKIRFTTDMKKLVSISEDLKIAIWDLNSRRLLKLLAAHTHGIETFSIFNQFAVSGGRDKKIIIWNIVTGSCINAIEGHLKGIVSLDFSECGNFILSGSLDHTMKIWNHRGDLVRSISHKSHPYARFIGNQIVSGHKDGTIRLWGSDNL